MVPNLPYFMVQFDHKGEKGYGHVIEGMSEAGGGGEDPDGQLDEGGKGGGDFPQYVFILFYLPSPVSAFFDIEMLRGMFLIKNQFLKVLRS